MSIASISATDVSKITSGQVIVDLTSVVKELVDNAIDAGCTNIEITFNDHGTNSVEVSDNGRGIDVSDFETLCLKHHTSKLTHFEDLESVATLGFRGEAMSSLCSVSKVKVLTSSSATFPRGTRLEYDSLGNILTKKSLVTGKKGTAITVSDLFHGWPVRQKNFVKHAKREYAKALNLLQAYVLTYTNIRFTVFNISGSTRKKLIILGTQGGCATISDVMTTLYGSNGAHGLIPLAISVKNIDARFKLNMSSVPMALGIGLSGVISDCSFGMGRAATDRQYFSINKRPVHHKKIGKILNEVYKSFNATQSPIYVLDLQLSSSLLDINITPDKRLVMIQCEDLICEVIREELVLLYEGRNNLVPKSEIGVIKIGSLQTISPQKNSDSFCSSQSTVNSSAPESSNVEKTGNIVHGNYGLERYRRPESVQESGLKTSHIEPDTSGSLPRSEISETLILPEAEKPDIPSSLKQLSNVLTKELGVQSSKVSKNEEASDEVDTFVDIDENDLRFCTLLEPILESKRSCAQQVNLLNRESPSKSHLGTLFVLDDDGEKIDFLGLSTQVVATDSNTVQNSNDDGLSRASINVLNGSGVISGEGGHSEILSSANKSRLSDDSPDREATENSHSSLKPTQKKRNSTSQLQGVQKLLSVTIENAKTYLACEAETQKAKTGLAHVQDISEAMEICKGDFTKMEIVGQFNSGFIIVCHGDKIFIVDQHALDEIFNYEKLMSELTLQAQPLVVPQVLELSTIDEMKILEFSEHLGRNGFSIEEIENAGPGRRVMLKGIPVLKNIVFDVSDLHELVHKLHEQGAETRSHKSGKVDDQSTPGRSLLSSCRCTKVDRMIASRACRLSIMIGLDLSRQTMTRVVKNLAKLDRPWNCPHGRPTMRHLADIQGTGFSEDYEI